MIVPALNAPAWLTARPIAHRGLHDAALGIVENTAAAARAAMAHGFAIECDVQLSRDGEAMVFHDFALDRLVQASGEVADHDAHDLQALPFKSGMDGMVALPAWLAVIGGAVPVICEIKSRFDGNMRLADRALAVVAAQDHPVALKSFDPAMVAHLRVAGAKVPLGVVAEAHYCHPEWANLPGSLKHGMANFLHYGHTRPDFLSYHVNDLPTAVPYLCRTGLNMPVMAWTVRTQAQRQLAAEWADQMVFEGFVP